MEVQVLFDPNVDFTSLLMATSHLQNQNELDPIIFSLSPMSSIGGDDSDFEDDLENIRLPPPLQVNPTSLSLDDSILDPAVFGLSPLSSIGEDIFDDPSVPPLLINDSSRAINLNAPAGPIKNQPKLDQINDNPNDTSSKRKRKRKNKEHSRAARKKKREAEKAAQLIGEYKVREEIIEKVVKKADPIACTLDFAQSDVTKSAFIGKDDRLRSKLIHTIEEIEGELGFTVHKWDGITPMPIIDQRRCFIGLLAGQPKDENWSMLQAEAVAAMEIQRPRCVLPKSKPGKAANRRGDFVTLSSGISHGGGQERPGNLRPDGSNVKGPNTQVLKELNELPIFKRLTGFVTAAIATWAPELHTHYVESLRLFHNAHPELERVFNNSILSAFTYNLGPRTVCYRHKDFGNLPYGLCAITSFGNYDPTRGGHLVLWECRVAIEFPPGSTILITSAVITHSNTAISAHERRYSFAQYTAGGLFRWVDHDFKTSEEYYKSFTHNELDKILLKEKQRWVHGLSLLPLIPERKRQLASNS